MAPFLALVMMLGVGTTYAAGPSTSTVGLDIISDVSEITAINRTLNLSVMGLDSYGNVDTLGESGGAAIIAAVQSVLGTVVLGGVTPGIAAGGSFATTTRYITLTNGNGMDNIVYAADASGTDTITVILMKSWTEIGQTYTEEITRQTLNVGVVPATPTAGVLNIENFTFAASDANGVAGNMAPATEALDIALLPLPVMTANLAGGVFTVNAYRINANRSYTLDTNANGMVTITLTGDPTAIEAGGNNRAGASDTYTFTGAMVNGVALAAVPAAITKAGQYKVVATMDTLDSIPDKVSDSAVTQDRIDVYPLETPASVGLACDMSVVSTTANGNWGTVLGDGVTFDPTFTTSLLDTYGNMVRAGAVGAAVIVKVTDANAKIPDFNITVVIGTNTNTSMQNGNSFTAGLASLTANVPANTLITASSSVSLKTIADANQLVTLASGGNTVLPLAPVTVGTTIANFFAGGLGVDNIAQDGIGAGLELNVLVATDSIKLISLTPLADGTMESVTVGVKDDNPDNIDALFTKPLANLDALANGFQIQNVGGSYADYIIIPDTISPFAVTAFSPTKAYVKNAAGEIITSIVPVVNADGSFTATINGARVGMIDAYFNLNNTGTLTITTLKGVVTGVITPGAGVTSAVINYPATTTGEDTLAFNFTQPGISSVNDGAGLKVVFPTVAALDHFDTSVADTILSINGLAPLTIIPRDVDGNIVILTDGYFIDYEAVGLNLQRAGGGAFPSGTTVGANTGRLAMRVFARTTPGAYTVTIRNTDGTITAEVEFTVVEYTSPLQVSSTTVSITEDGNETITVSGGVAPYTISSADNSTATVSSETLSAPGDFTITGAAVGMTTVTVTDIALGTVDIAVTVTPSVLPPQPVPTGQTITELTGDDLANAPVNMGSVVTGGDQMELALNFPAYEAAVDVYAAVIVPPDCSVFFVASDNTLTTDIVAYAKGVTDATNVTVCGSFAVCNMFGNPTVPTGTWQAYSMVVPTNGGDFTAIDWDICGYDIEWYTFDITCP